MARGRKKVTPKERLSQIENEIEQLAEKLASLKEEKKNVEKEIREKEINELYEIVKTSGKSMEEVRMLLGDTADGMREE